jgi:hypothetical protein
MAYPSLSVSRHLSTQGEVEYDANQMCDGEASTAWVVKKGPGEWFELRFEPDQFHPDFRDDSQRTGVDSLYIWNGYNKSLEHWRNHARVHKADLSVDGEHVCTIALLDDARPQIVTLPKTPLHRDIRFRFTIRSVYPGDKYDEVAVSEVRLDGYGHH